MMNIQFVIKDEKVYVIEVNPRASRTVPFLSKVTNIPMAQVATKLILGQKLEELGYQDGLYPESTRVHIKAPVFSFTKLAKVDSLLGPEMKSTGEVMGSDTTLEKALYKAFEASYLHLPTFGNVVFTIADDAKEEALDLACRSKILAMESSRQKGQQPSLPVMDCKPNLLVRLVMTIRIFQALFVKEEFKLSLTQ